MNIKKNKITSIFGWLSNAKTRFLALLLLIRSRKPFALIKVKTVDLLVHILIYPFSRVILGKEKTSKLCSSLLSACFPLVVSSENKMILCDFVEFETYLEIHVYNGYFEEFLKEGMIVVDIGAHTGIYTTLAAQKIGQSGKVVAVEPVKENYEQLIKNIELNNFKNVILKKTALSDHSGSEKLYISPHSNNHSLMFKESENAYLEVPVDTLDNLLKKLNLTSVDVIKIDTEGAEVPILKGAERTLEANPKIKVIVASYHYPTEVKEVCQLLSNKDFKPKIFQRSIVTT